MFTRSFVFFMVMQLLNATRRINEPLLKKTIGPYIPKSLNQQRYVDVLDNFDRKIIVATGPAGTGKTLFACKKGIETLHTGKLQKIVLTRPLVTVEEDLGFLPGNIDDKMSPWTRPIFDIFLERYTKSELDRMIQENIIEVSPLAFMRGRTFKDTFIIADEMQNSSPSQMKMLTTRIGKGSRLIITGDMKQSDRMGENGLEYLVRKMSEFYKSNPSVPKMVDFISLDSDDVQRSKIVKHMIDVYSFTTPDYYPFPPFDDFISS
uniref:PhoH-like protein n=1 Tax=viral metagenome TaxID=1070528 RepID=A0A6C0HJ92_9ZZZZ